MESGSVALQITCMCLGSEGFSGPTVHRFNKNRITLGSSEKNDLILDNPDVAPRHAMFRLVNGARGASPKLMLTDLGSPQGTVVKDIRIAPNQEIAVELNDRILVGNYLIRPNVLFDPLDTIKNQDSFNQVRNGGRAELPSNGKKDMQSLSPLVDRMFEASPVTPSSALSGEKISGKNASNDVLADGQNGIIRARIDNSGIENLDFEAEKLFGIEGSVIHKGKPLSGVKVEALGIGVTISDSEGNFSFGDLPEGTSYTLVLSKPGYFFRTKHEAVGVIEEPVLIEFSAVQLFTVRGRVLHRGKPLAGVEIDGGAFGRTITAGDGSYAFHNVPEDSEVTVQASKPGFALRPKLKKAA